MILLKTLIEHSSYRDQVIQSLFFAELHIYIKNIRFDSSKLTTLTKLNQLETEAKNDLINLSLIQNNINTKINFIDFLIQLKADNIKQLKYLFKLVMINEDYTFLENMIKLLAIHSYKNREELEVVLACAADGLWLASRGQHKRLESILNKLKIDSHFLGNTFNGKFYHVLDKLINCETVEINIELYDSFT